MKLAITLSVFLFSASAFATKLIDRADLHSRDAGMLSCFSSTFSGLFQQSFGKEFDPSEFRVSQEVSTRFESSDRSRILANPEGYQGMAFYFDLGMEILKSDCRISFYTQSYGETGAEYNFWIQPRRDSCEINGVKIDSRIKLSTGQRRFLPNPYFIYDLKHLIRDESGKLISFDETIRYRAVSNTQYLPEQIFLKNEDSGELTKIFVQPRVIRDCLILGNSLTAF